MAKTSKTMLNSNGESGHHCLVPDFRGNAFNFSPLRIHVGSPLTLKTAVYYMLHKAKYSVAKMFENSG